MSRENWIWMPHPGHFICAAECKFHLNTKVGNYIISTVGEYLPESAVRDILAKSRGIELDGIGDYRKRDFLDKIGFEEIGFNRKYETMVFRAGLYDPSSCCPSRPDDFSALDDIGYNDPREAYEGHLAMCRKWDSHEEEETEDPCS